MSVHPVITGRPEVDDRVPVTVYPILWTTLGRCQHRNLTKSGKPW